MDNLIELLSFAEKLKSVLRHSWLSSGRHESTAEHTWRMALMAMVIAPKLEHPVEANRAIRMAIVHDLVEAEVGDVPAWQFRERKAQRAVEADAVVRLRKRFPDQSALFDLWEEYERSETPEAKFVKALDRVEAQLQHIEAPFDTLTEIEHARGFYAPKRFCAHDATLRALADTLDRMHEKRVRAAGLDVAALRKRAAELEREEKNI